MSKIPVPTRLSVAALALEAASRGISRDTRLLIQLRASFLNGCSYCIDLHTKEALKSGWREERIDTLRDTAPNTWNTVELTEKEQLILEFTDAGTGLTETSPAALNEIEERVLAEFGPDTTGDFIAAITAINMWNRIGILFGK